MTTHVKLDLSEAVQWPARCAVCGRTTGLASFSVFSVRDKSWFIPVPGVGMYVHAKKLNLSFEHPICKVHQASNARAYTLSTQVARQMVFASLSLLVLLLVFSSPLGHALVWLLFVLGIGVAFYSAIVGEGAVVRVKRFSEGGAELIFANDGYAKDFIELNAPLARYLSKTRSYIGI